MARSVKHGGKKTYRYKNKKNSSTAKKKAVKKRKAAGHIDCKEVREEWDKTKSTKQNLELMGLAYDVNKAMQLESFSGGTANAQEEAMDIAEARALGSVRKQREKVRTKAQRFLSSFEKRAALCEKVKANRNRKCPLSQRDIDFCRDMVEKYGEDYQAMSRDAKNLFQDTAKQIEKKIKLLTEK